MVNFLKTALFDSKVLNNYFYSTRSVSHQESHYITHLHTIAPTCIPDIIKYETIRQKHHPV